MLYEVITGIRWHVHVGRVDPADPVCGTEVPQSDHLVGHADSDDRLLRAVLGWHAVRSRVRCAEHER